MDEEGLQTSDNSFRRRQKREEYIGLLKHNVTRYGFELQCNVPYNGNGFFHAICFHLGRKDPKHLRQEVVAFLQTKACGPLRATLDYMFLKDLRTNGADVKEERVG